MKSGSVGRGATLAALVLVARRSHRRGRAGWWTVTLMAALITAVVLGSFAAARRTAETYPQVLDRIAAADVVLGIGNPDDEGTLGDREVAELPGVEEAGLLRFHLGAQLDADGLMDPNRSVSVVSPVDGSMWQTVERPLVVRGGMPATDDADAVAISSALADRLRLDVGDRIRFGLVRVDEIERVMAGDLSVGHRPNPRVAAIVQPTDFSGTPEDPFGTDAILTTPAFADAYPGTSTFRLAYVRLADGPDGAGAFSRAVEEILGSGPDLDVRSATTEEVARAVRPDVVPVLLLGALTALAGLALLTQAVARQLAAHRDDQGQLRALGLLRGGIATTNALAAISALLPGVAFGAVVAFLASPIAPIGIIRGVAPDPGFELDPAIHVGGAVLAGVALTVLSALLGWMLAAPRRSSPRPTRSSRLAQLVSVAPMPWNVAAALATSRRSSRRHVRSLALGLACAVVVAMTASTFVSSSDRLLATPALYGHGYDVAAWDGYGQVADEDIAEFLATDPEVTRSGAVASTTAAVSGVDTELFGLELVDLGPSVLDGRLPTARSEILLGRRLAADLGVAIGDPVEVVVGSETRTVTAVGIGVVPVSGGGGGGAVMTLDGLRDAAPETHAGFQYVELADPTALSAITERFLAAFDGCAVDCDFLPPSPPTDVARLASAQPVPTLFGLAVAAAAVLAAIQATIALLRHNQFALALLRALGSRRRGAARCVVAQVVYAVAAALLLGVPLGLLVGRQLWSAVAGGLGVVPSVSVPIATISALLGATAVVGYVSVRVGTARGARRSIAGTLGGRAS